MLLSLCPRCTQNVVFPGMLRSLHPKVLFFFFGILPSPLPKVLLFSRDFARSAPKSAVFQGFCSLRTRCFLTSSCLAPWLAQLELDKPPCCGPIQGIFFDVRKGGHIPTTPSSRPMSQRKQRHRRTTRIHIKKLSLESRGRNTITRQQPHYITQINSREICFMYM